jgi:predicted small lipoprotein YifL
MLMLPRVAGVLLLSLVLQACGTKGPLFLPPPDQKPAPSDQPRK